MSAYRHIPDVVASGAKGRHMTQSCHWSTARRLDVDLEIEIERPGRLWASFEDAVEGIEKEQPLTSNLAMLVTPVAKLTKRAVLSR